MTLTGIIASGRVTNDELMLGISAFGDGRVILSVSTGDANLSIHASDEAARDFALEIIATIREAKAKRAAAAAVAEPEPLPTEGGRT